MYFTISNNKFWKQFFRLYRSMPELWQTTSELYKNKNKKRKALERLLSKYREYDNTANLDTLKHRIKNIRACYKREWRKVEKSRKSNDSENVYLPNLWYYSELEFLTLNDDVEFDGMDFSSKTNDEETMTEEDDEANELLEAIKLANSKRKRNYQENDTYGDDWSEEVPLKHNEDVIEETQHYLGDQHERKSFNISRSTDPFATEFNNTMGSLQQRNDDQERDEAKVYAEGWAISYRKLSNNQRIMARKAIEEIFFLGQLDQLTASIVRMPEEKSSTTKSASNIVEYGLENDIEVYET